jgi:hypothetical protein
MALFPPVFFVRELVDSGLASECIKINEKNRATERSNI